MSYLTHLECTRCGARLDATRAQTVCPLDRAPLFARYNLTRAAVELSRERLDSAESKISEQRRGMWRYGPLLPCDDPITLGEGNTPLLQARRLGQRLGLDRLLIKDEGLNPTGTFKARGLSCAVSMARQFGIKKMAVPTAGNAGSALAAYASRAGIDAHIFAPRDVPKANIAEYRSYGARVTLVNGLISDCAREVSRLSAEGWFDVSTTKEPYRVEGKKTMGYEVVEQLGWQVPDVIFYPCGGGVGLIGMWKAFDELEALGWIGAARPRMVAVQASGCAPVVTAFEQGQDTCEAWPNAATSAAGLRVPKPYADALILRVLYESHGTALAVSEQDIADGVKEMATLEGVLPAPEGAAVVPAPRRLRLRGWIQPHETVVLFNTGSGLKYLT